MSFYEEFSKKQEQQATQQPQAFTPSVEPSKGGFYQSFVEQSAPKQPKPEDSLINEAKTAVNSYMHGLQQFKTDVDRPIASLGHAAGLNLTEAYDPRQLVINNLFGNNPTSEELKQQQLQSDQQFNNHPLNQANPNISRLASGAGYYTVPGVLGAMAGGAALEGAAPVAAKFAGNGVLGHLLTQYPKTTLLSGGGAFLYAKNKLLELITGNH